MVQANDRVEILNQDPLGVDLQHQRALLEAIFEADPGALAVLIGPDLRYAFANPAYRYLHLTSNPELIGSRYSDAGFRDGHSMYLAELQAVYATGKPFIHEGVEHTFPDGARRIFNMQARRIDWEKEAAILLILWDITERKLIENALQESNRKYQELVRFAPAGIYEVDFRTRKYTSVNDVICEITGYSRQELLTMDAFDLIDEEGQKLFQKRIQQWLAGEKPTENIEYRVKTKDGRLIDALLNVTFKRDEAGRPKGATVVAIDITARKKAEDTFHESQMLLKAVIENTQDPIFVKDRQSRILLANQALANVVGKPIEDLIGKTDSEYYGDAEIGQALRENDLKVMESGANLSAEETVMTQQGWRTYLSAKAPYRDPEGHVIGILGISRDITERKNAEAEAQTRRVQIELQRRLLEQREQERMEIARDLHDGPMQEILGAIYALRGMIATEADDNLTNGLRGVVETLNRQLAELRAYAGELRPPTLVQFGLAKAFQAHIESYQEKYPNIQVHLEVSQTGEQVPDPMRLALYRIYQEAMNNIARHCQKAKVKVTFKKTRENARLEISDDGPGIEIPNDWLALARAGHLGLVGMRERAEAVGGRLEIESKPGGGTTIRVEVPLGETG